MESTIAFLAGWPGSGKSMTTKYLRDNFRLTAFQIDEYKRKLGYGDDTRYGDMWAGMTQEQRHEFPLVLSPETHEETFPD